MNMTYQVRLDKRKLDQIIQQSPQKAGRVVRALALEGERIAKASMGPGPAPSSPGEPPHVQTGALRASIRVENRGSFTQAITTSVDYAPYLEYGTRKMSARPFMGPMARELERISGDFFDGFLE
jgi:HK97 gp10 family phage protein